MIKNQQYIGQVLSYGINGEGVLKEDGYVVFLPFALKGETVEYKVLKVSGKVVYAKLVRVIERSKDRVEPFCPHFGKCGGCNLQHIDYKAGLNIKRDNIRDCFYKIAGVSVAVNDTVTGDSPFRYRNKISVPVREEKGKTVIGFYAENSHRVVPIEDCGTEFSKSKNIISAFSKFIDENALKGYNEVDFTGDIREITAREVGGKYIICAVTLKPALKNSKRLIEILKEELNAEFSLFINVNDGKSNVIYGEDFRLVYGQPFYYGEEDGIRFPIGVRSFMQVNDGVRKLLYSAVAGEIEKGYTVIDAYSGAGLMTAMFAKKTGRAIGVEIIQEAVLNADGLKRENGLDDKMENICGKCEEILPDLIERENKKGNKTVVVLDPPRKGIDRNVAKSVRNSGAEKIVYVSCMPSTLARDIGLITGTLIDDGEIKKAENPEIKYEITSVTPFEMFPFTRHIETVCVLKRI